MSFKVTDILNAAEIFRCKTNKQPYGILIHPDTAEFILKWASQIARTNCPELKQLDQIYGMFVFTDEKVPKDEMFLIVGMNFENYLDSIMLATGNPISAWKDMYDK